MKRLCGLFVLSGLLFTACGSPGVEPQVRNGSDVDGWGEAVAQGNAAAAQIESMSSRDEEKLGAEIDAALKDPAKKNEVGMTISLVRDPVVRDFVYNLGQRLAANSSRRDISYKFQVVDSKEVNAFATCGGFVYINSALIKLADNKAELAGVIAHEVAHISSRHTVKAMAERARVEGWAQGVGGLGGVLVRVGASAAVSSPRSRTAEYEADKLGFLNLRASGIAAVGMKNFFQKLMALSGNAAPGMFSTHPATGNRIRALEMIEVPSDSRGDGLDSREYKWISARL